MAWIESHQELAHHPKVGRLANMLDVAPTQAIGLLHCFWWWCLSYADDGDVTDFDAYEIAWGAQWQGDPDTFVKALAVCGWLDDVDGRTEVHDWFEYAGKLVERRRADAERKRKARSKTSTERPPDVHKDGVRTNQTNQTNLTAATFEDFHKQRCVRKARANGARSPEAYARSLVGQADEIAESEFQWDHRDCDNCESGYVSTYAPGAGSVKVKCSK